MGVESESPLDKGQREGIGWRLWENKPPTRYLSFPFPINVKAIKIDAAILYRRIHPPPPSRSVEHVAEDRVTREERRRVVAGILASLGISAAFKWGVLPLARRSYETARLSDEVEEHTISWTYLFKGAKEAGNEPRQVVELYSGGLTRKQSLDRYETWADNTELGFYVQGLHDFVDDLMTSKSREKLQSLIPKYEHEMDLGGAREAIAGVDKYAKGGDLTMGQLADYFRNKLSFTQEQWRDIEIIYKVVETRDSSVLKSLISQSTKELSQLFRVPKKEVVDVSERVGLADEVLRVTGADKIVSLDVAAAFAQTIPQEYTRRELLIATKHLVPDYVAKYYQGQIDIFTAVPIVLSVLCRSPKLRNWARKSWEGLKSIGRRT